MFGDIAEQVAEGSGLVTFDVQIAHAGKSERLPILTHRAALLRLPRPQTPNPAPPGDSPRGRTCARGRSSCLAAGAETDCAGDRSVHPGATAARDGARWDRS